MPIPDALNSLTDDEKKVLWYKCKKDYTHKQIAKVMGYADDWVQLQMSRVYPKLDWQTKNVHWTALEKRLKAEVCPLLPEKLGDFLSSSTGTEEENKAEEPPIEGIAVEEPLTAPRLEVILGILIVLAIIAGGIYWFLLRPQPANPPVVPITPQNTPVSSPFPTQVFPTSAPATPQLLPTDTSVPAVVDTAVPQVKDFYNQGEFAPLKNGVFVRLMTDFFGEIGQCQQPKPGFGVTLEFRTYSSGQYLLRYDPTAFSAVDDLGNNYPLTGAGTTRCDAFGIQNIQAGDYTYMYLAFSGQFPLDAQYLIITADSLSGVKVVFHKSL